MPSLFLALLALLLAGCGLPYRIALPIQVNGTGTALQQAIDTWNQAAGRTLVLESQDGYPVVKVHGYLPDAHEPGSTIIGDWDGHQIRYCDCLDSDPQRLRVTLTHEIGHALGLPHNPDPASPMFWANQTTNFTPDARDIAALDERIPR